MSSSFPHEALVELFRNRPLLAAELAQAVHPDLVAAEATLGTTDLGELAPTELRADVVVRLVGPELRCCVVVEVQLAHDPTKFWTWPAYLANLRARERSDVYLLVLTLDARLAGRLARPIPLGQRGFTLVPMVIGPNDLPVITDPAVAARSPELAVLSALAHGGGPQGEAIGRAAASIVHDLDDTRARLYVDLILDALNDGARRALEALMLGEYQYRSEFMRNLVQQNIQKGLQKGLDEGERAMLQRMLRARFGPLPDAVVARLETAELAQIERWADHVFLIASPEELLAIS